LRARAGEDGVPAAQAVRRTRVGYLVLGLVVAAGIVVPGLLQRFGVIRGGASAAGVLAGFVGWFAMELMPYAWRTVTHEAPHAHLVTARTLTGLRTVDLDRLTRVRRYRSRSRNGWIDILGVEDRSGVGFRFDDKALARRVATAVRRSRSSPADATAPPPVDVSRFAAARLGLTSSDRAGGRAVADFALSVLVPLCAVLLGALAAGLLAAA
jgi:hypothetical protein